jgi:hypothetical protein
MLGVLGVGVLLLLCVISRAVKVGLSCIGWIMFLGLLWWI